MIFFFTKHGKDGKYSLLDKFHPKKDFWGKINTLWLILGYLFCLTHRRRLTFNAAHFIAVHQTIFLYKKTQVSIFVWTICYICLRLANNVVDIIAWWKARYGKFFSRCQIFTNYFSISNGCLYENCSFMPYFCSLSDRVRTSQNDSVSGFSWRSITIFRLCLHCFGMTPIILQSAINSEMETFRNDFGVCERGLTCMVLFAT